MKKLSFLAISVLVLAGCQNGGKTAADLSTMQLRDSLDRIITQKDNEINDMISTLNDIEEGFREINAAQGRVSVAKQGEGASSADRIRENMEFIQSAMQQNRELIAKLRQQVRESSVKGDELKRTIENLTAQLEEKDRQLQALRAELEAKDIHIAELDTQIEDLNSSVSSLQEESSKKSETISSQDKELNTAWYVFGTKSELKAHNILKDGEVLREDFHKDYFTKIDIRVDKEVKLFSRSAKLLTSHPSGSYTLQRDANKQYVLRITDPTAFWSTSKYLVVQVK